MFRTSGSLEMAKRLRMHASQLNVGYWSPGKLKVHVYKVVVTLIMPVFSFDGTYGACTWRDGPL